MAKGNINKTFNNVANMSSFDNMASGGNGNNLDNMQPAPQKPRMSDLNPTAPSVPQYENQRQRNSNSQVMTPNVANNRAMNVQQQQQQIGGNINSSMDLLGNGTSRRKKVVFKPDEKPTVTAALPTVSKKIKILIVAIITLIILIIVCVKVKPVNNAISQLFGNYNNAWATAQNDFYNNNVYTWGDEWQEYLTNFTVNNGFQGSIDNKSLTIVSDGKQLYIKYMDNTLLTNEKNAYIDFNDIACFSLSEENLAYYVGTQGFSYDDIAWFRTVNLPEMSNVLSSDEAIHKILDPIWAKLIEIPCKNTRTAKIYQLEDFKVGMSGVIQAIKGNKDWVNLVTNSGMSTQDFYNLMSAIESNISSITGVDGTVSLIKKSDTLLVLDVGTDVFTIDLSEGCSIEATNFYFKATPSDFSYSYKGYSFSSTVNCDSGMLFGQVVTHGVTLEFDGSSIRTNKGTFDFIPIMQTDFSEIRGTDIDLTRFSTTNVEEAKEGILSTLDKADIDYANLAGYLGESSIDYEYNSDKLKEYISTWLFNWCKNDLTPFHVSKDTIGRNKQQELRDATSVANANALAIYKGAVGFITECGSAPDGAYSGILTEKSGNINYKPVFDIKNMEACLGMSVNSGYYCFVVKNNTVTYASWSATVDLPTLVANRNIKKSYDYFNEVEEVIGTYPLESGA